MDTRTKRRFIPVLGSIVKEEREHCMRARAPETWILHLLAGFGYQGRRSCLATWSLARRAFELSRWHHERFSVDSKSPRRESTVREPHSGVPGESRAIWKLHHCLEIALCFNSRYNPLRIIAARIFPQIRNRNQNPPTDSPGWQTPGRNEIVDSAFAD